MEFQFKHRHTLHGLVAAAILSMSLSSIAPAVPQDLTLFDLKFAAAKALLDLAVSSSLALGEVPGVRALSSYNGADNSCMDSVGYGVVCADAANIYVDDALLQEGKEFSLKPPKTGIPVIDNNREIISGAATGTVLAGGVGTLVGIWWGDHIAAQAKIDELRRQNQQDEANLGQAKLDVAKKEMAFAEERTLLMNNNACLVANTTLQGATLTKIESLKTSFNTCLSQATSDAAAQACLNSFDSDSSNLIEFAKLLSACH